MIVHNPSDQTDFSYDFPWKSPIPKRSKFDRLLVWMLVFVCGSVVAGFGMIVLYPNGFSNSGFSNNGAGACGIVERDPFEQPLLTIQSVEESAGTLVWEVKVASRDEGKSYHEVSYSIYGDIYQPADFNDGEIIIRIDDPEVVEYNRLYITYETDEGHSGGPLVYDLNFRAHADALKIRPEGGSTP